MGSCGLCNGCGLCLVNPHRLCTPHPPITSPTEVPVGVHLVCSPRDASLTMRMHVCPHTQVERGYRQGYSELDVHENGGACCHVCPHKPLFRDLSMLYLHANGNLPSSPERAAKSTTPEYPRCEYPDSALPCTLPRRRNPDARGA